MNNKPKVIFVFGKFGSNYEDEAKKLSNKFAFPIIPTYTTIEDERACHKRVSLQTIRKSQIFLRSSFGYGEEIIRDKDFDLKNDQIYVLPIKPFWIESLVYQTHVNYLPVFIDVDDKQRLINAIEKFKSFTPQEICNTYIKDNGSAGGGCEKCDYYDKEKRDSIICKNIEDLYTNERFLKFIGADKNEKN